MLSVWKLFILFVLFHETLSQTHLLPYHQHKLYVNSRQTLVLPEIEPDEHSDVKIISIYMFTFLYKREFAFRTSNV